MSPRSQICRLCRTSLRFSTCSPRPPAYRAYSAAATRSAPRRDLPDAHFPGGQKAPADATFSDPKVTLALLQQALLGEDAKKHTDPRHDRHSLQSGGIGKSEASRDELQPTSENIYASPSGAPSLETATNLGSIIDAFNSLLRAANYDHEEGQVRLARALSAFHHSLARHTGSTRRERRLDDMRAFSILTGTIRRNGYQLGPELCELGIKYAARSKSWVALRSLLDECKKEEYPLSFLTLRWVIYELLLHARRKGASEFRFGAWQKRDAMELLTGWVGSGVPGANEERKISVASFIPSDNVDLVDMYLSALAKLGACAAISQSWLEFREHSAKKAALAELEAGADDQEERMVGIYVRALRKAGDRAAAAQLKVESGAQSRTGRQHRSELEKAWPEAFAGIPQGEEEVLRQLELILQSGAAEQEVVEDQEPEQKA